MVALVIKGEAVGVFRSADEAIEFAEREWLVDYKVEDKEDSREDTQYEYLMDMDLEESSEVMPDEEFWDYLEKLFKDDEDED